MNKKRLKITLEANGIHSFNRGLEIFAEYEKTKDKFLLKEAIMFLHHGIELLMKQILINNSNEALLFSDSSQDTIKKIINAKKKNISVFELSKPPNTATYVETIDRLIAFVDKPKIEESLRTRLGELNIIRNRIEHYGVNEDILRIEKLMINLRLPLLRYFKLANINLLQYSFDKWSELEKQLIIEVSRLRGGGSIKNAEIINGKAILEYVENYAEYKLLQPQSMVLKKEWESYWETGDAILKAINDGGVRLLRKLNDLQEVRITLPHKKGTYIINIIKEELENFLGYTVEELKNDWDNKFSNNYVYTSTGREAFFNKFGTFIKNIE